MEIYFEAPPAVFLTVGMMDVIVGIVAEVLCFLAIATREIKHEYPHHHITTMGNEDNLFTVLFLNSLGDQIGNLQSMIQAMSAVPGFYSESIVKRIEDWEYQTPRRTEKGLQHSTVNSADFYIAPGSKMACRRCRTIGEERTAQLAASGNSLRAPRAEKTKAATNPSQTALVPLQTTSMTIDPASQASNNTRPITLNVSPVLPRLLVVGHNLIPLCRHRTPQLSLLYLPHTLMPLSLLPMINSVRSRTTRLRSRRPLIGPSIYILSTHYSFRPKRLLLPPRVWLMMNPSSWIAAPPTTYHL